MNLPCADNDGQEVQGEVVATAATPFAAETAISVLNMGGTAFDAAIAAALVECVELPMKCGLAGDVVALVQRCGGYPEALVSIGPGAAGHHPGALEVVGPRSVGIPGAPGGYAELASLGCKPLGELAAPAIELALNGPVWTAIARQLTRETAPALSRYNGSLRYLPGGRVPEIGERVPLPGLASVIEQFVREGRQLYSGALGHRLRERLGENCLLAESDLGTPTAVWCAPVVAEISKARLMATPTPTHGPSLLEAVQLVCAGTDSRDAVRRVGAGLDSGTSVLTAADAEGNAVVLVHSNSFPNYGAGVVIEELDLVLNNRPGRGFNLTATDKHPNAPSPGRVPESTLHAWVLEHDGQRYLGATPGGRNQLPWNLQAIFTLIQSGSLSCAVAGPRWAFDGTAASFQIEANHTDAATGGGRTVPSHSLRSAEQIIARPLSGGLWRAAADPRIGSVARAG